MTKNCGIEFDPGFGPYIMAFAGTTEYLYADINRFKNFSQKKAKFLQYHKKFLEMFNNNLGFYVGCLMWAAYIKALPTQEILSNHCFGKEYNEEDSIAETKFMLQFTELYPKDAKYFISQNCVFDEKYIELIKTYEKFLTLNKAFVDSKTNDDIKLPQNVKIDNSKTYKEKIDRVLETGDLSKLLDFLPEII